MSNWNPDSPWNPAISVDISPDEYEKQVVFWLKKGGRNLTDFSVTHLSHMQGQGGNYEVDAVVKFSILDGTLITILVECKRYSKPVERDLILALWAKMQDVNAQKAIMFSTSGYQKGAIQFAKSKNIATIAFVDGKSLYITKSSTTHSTPPSWINLPKYAGIIYTEIGDSLSCTTIENQRIEPFSELINSL